MKAAHLRTVSALGLLGLTAGVHGPASAQSAGASLEEIVVTAQFREQTVQDTPIAITAMTGDMLNARSQIDITDVSSFAPNVNITPSHSQYGSAISAFVRGVGQMDGNFALEPGVGVYIDDIYYGSTVGAVFDLSDLDRVEVLRGPQGTLAGKNSIGGAVKLYSTRPGEETDGYVEVTGGSYDRIDVKAAANITLAEGLYMRVSGITRHRDGFLDRLDFGCANPGQGIAPSPVDGTRNCKIGTEGGQDVNAAKVALRYAPAGSPLEVNIVGDFMDENSEPVATKITYADNPDIRSYDADNPAGGVPFDERFITGPKSYTNYATYDIGGNYTTAFGTLSQVAPGGFDAGPRNDVRAYGLSGSVDYDLSESLSIKSITGYRKAQSETVVDFDGSPLNIVLQDNTLTFEQFTQELRLTGHVDDLIDYTVGGYYYDSQGRLEQRVVIPPVLLDFLSNDPVDTKSKSAFAHVEVHASERLSFIGGLRYTRDRKTYTFSRQNIDGSDISGIPFTTNFTVAALDGVSDTFKGDRWDFRLGANYRWTDNLMTYAQVATGFKGGGVNPRPYDLGQVQSFAPEKLTSYELGFKSDLLDHMLRMNGAVFYNEYDDMQLVLLACPGVPCSMPANAGNAHMKGAELEASLMPVQGLTVEGSLGYLDFDYQSVNPATGVEPDFVAPFVSEWQASLSVRYDAELASGAVVTPRVDWAYLSSFYHNAVNNPYNRVDGRGIVNARLTYQSPDALWQASLAVTNLTDRFYYVGHNENVIGYGVNQSILGRPREWSVSLRRSF